MIYAIKVRYLPTHRNAQDSLRELLSTRDPEVDSRAVLSFVGDDRSISWAGAGMRTHRFFVSVLVAGAMVAAGFMNPGLAAATVQNLANTGSVAPSCATPPDDPDATPANRDRFVDLWSHRFADHDWMTAYAKLQN